MFYSFLIQRMLKPIPFISFSITICGQVWVMVLHTPCITEDPVEADQK